MTAPTTKATDQRRKSLPPFLYGTAWKEDDTARLTRQALALGFRGIDTANQRKHYHEAAVGEAVTEALGSGRLSRDELFLQTKFTHRGGQDHRLPYDPHADVGTQVAQSLASSLAHLGTDHVDAYLLHGPSQRRGLADADRDAFRAMLRLEQSGEARRLGASNVQRDQLEELCALKGAPLAFVQNRCYASKGWDREVRAFCAAHGIVYQGFSLLTANAAVMQHPRVARIGARLGATPAQVIFRFALQAGMLPLTGTSSPAHAAQDLAVPSLPPLTDEEMSALEVLGES